MSIFKNSGNPEDHLPDHWKAWEKRLSHRQGKITGGDLKRLYEATTHILAVYADNDMCMCDGPDYSVGIGPVTCEAHQLAYLVEDLICSSMTPDAQKRMREELRQERS